MIRLAFLAVCAAVFLAVLPAAEATPTSRTPVYRIGDYPYPTAPALLQWQSVLQRNTIQESRWTGEECADGEPRLDCAAAEMARLEEELRALAPREQVAAVYQYFNAVAYREHGPNCGPDCWATRLDFIANGYGDCGDHALAEYFTLRRLGFDDRDLQLVIAQLRGYEDSFKGGHVVLRVRVDDEYFVLDNRRQEIVGLHGLKTYKVLAGLNAESVQIYNLITPAPPPGFVDDVEQVAALVLSPGAEAVPAPDETDLEPVLVASRSTTDEQPEAGEDVPASQETAEESCVQSASLADWNPNLPCVPKMKIVVVAKNDALTKPAKPATAPEPAEVPAVVAAASQPAPAAEAPAPIEVEPDVVAALPAAPIEEPASEPVAAPQAEEADAGGGGCVQTAARLEEWDPDQPCVETANSFKMTIKAKTIIQ